MTQDIKYKNSQKMTCNCSVEAKRIISDVIALLFPVNVDVQW